MWRIADAPDGRKYYYHIVTQQTTWEKPADFDAPNGAAASPVTPQASSAGEWKEAKAADGRTYYYNSVTNVTQWDKPAGFQAAGDRPAFQEQAVERGYERRESYRDQGLPSKPTQDAVRPGNMPWERRLEGFTGAAPARADEPLYQSPEEAEEAFFGLLRSHDIKWDAAWPDVIRQVGKEKGFRAFKDAGERREKFEKFCQEEKLLESAREQERKRRRHDEFLAMLRLHEEIKYYTRSKTAFPALEREIPYRNALNDEERKQIFAEHKAELLKQHAQEEAESRQHALQELRNLMSALVTSSSTKWQEAYDMLKENKRFANEELFGTLSKGDILQVFENHIKLLDHDRNDKKQRQKALRYRRERQARDAFKDLLREQLKAGYIKAGTAWQDFYPRIASDGRYKNLLGLPGSSPLDLFWDCVDEQEQKLRAVREDALDVLDAQRFEMVPSTSYDEFAAVMSRDRKTNNISTSDLELIYKRIMDKVKRRHRDQQALAERGQQDAIDDFRSALRHLDPPVYVDDKYDEVAVKLDTIPASRVLTEDTKRAAFDRHIRRLKDKAADRESERRRECEKDHRNGSRRSHDYDRERDRRHRSRSPEIDAYEADRRKAQADRERQYRKASFGLTPPPRERRDPRDPQYGWESRRGDKYDNVYERERKEREFERDRSYISRADPRDKGKVSALDYGDDDAVESNSSSVQKRRVSDGSAASKRDTKRARHETEAPAVQDEPALQSGSEEGEIEELDSFKAGIMALRRDPLSSVAAWKPGRIHAREAWLKPVMYFSSYLVYSIVFCR